LDIRRISWEDAIPVRHQVLWPDHPPEFCYVEGDRTALHYGVFVNSTLLVSVASIYICEDKARLRKFATLQNYQGQGIGSALLEYALANLKQEDIKYFWCDARESAVNFYKRFKLQVEGDRFYKTDIPYYKMSCNL
jgi:GNAT superfamily N-acetyltransferase